MIRKQPEDDNNLGRRTRVEKPYVITMSRVSYALDIKVEPNLAQVLNDTKAKLRIEIGADNSAHVSIVDEVSGDRIGVLRDIEKIAKFKRFIEEEKKITKNLDLLGPIEGRLVHAFKNLIAQKEWKDLPFPNLRAEQLVALKESELKTRRLESNRMFLEEYMRTKQMDPSERSIAIVIHAWLIGSLEANAKLYEWVLTGMDSVRRLSDELFAQVVPIWAYKRLSQTNIALVTDMRRVIFPQNTRAGLHLSVREMFDVGFRNRHATVLANSGFQIRLLSDAQGLKTVLNLPIVPNFKDEKALKEADLLWLLDSPILISPVWFGLDYIFEPKAKGKVPNFDPPRYTTSQGSLKSIVNAIVSMQVFEFRTDQQIGEIWDKISIGLGINGIFRENISAKNNLYRVALTKADLLESRVRGIVECHGLQAKKFMVPRTRAQLMTSAGSELETIVFKHMGIDNVDQKGTKIVISNSLPPPEGRPRADMFVALCEPTGIADAALMKVVQKNIGLRKMTSVRADRQYGVEVTRLSAKAISLMEQLKIKRSTANLVPGIENWLKSFVHENFQAAGLKQVELHFSDDVHDEEDSPGESPDDDNEEEE